MEIACVDIEPRVCKVCEPGVENGNVIAVVFVKNDRKITDYFDDFTWLTLDYKAQAIFVHKTRGTFTSEPIQTPGYGKDGEITIGYNHTLNYSEPFDCALRKHYEGLQKSSEYRAIFLTDKGIKDGGAVAKISVDTPVGEVGTILEYVVTVTWTSDGLIPCESGTPPGLLTDCALFEQLKLIFCPPATPACIEQGEILVIYGNDVYPGTPGTYEVDYTFEDVASYPIVALQQTTPAQAFFDTFDVVENGVIIASADPARLGITGINSMADLVAATPLNAFNQSQWAVKYDPSNSYRVATWYNNGIGGGILKSVKVYVRGFAQLRLHLFCAPAIFTPDAFLLPFEPKNAYVVSEATRVCLCPKLTVSPLTSELLLDGSPAPNFLELDPNTTYEYSLTGNFIDAEWQRKVCCGFPSVMFVFIGSSTVVLSASNVGPITVDGVTFTYDPLTYTVTVETPADVTGINFTAAASVTSCETHTHAFGLGDCAPPDIRFLAENVTDVSGYLAANPAVNAVVAITGSGTGVTYFGSGYSYDWTTPQTNTMTINANIVAPNDRYPIADCCPEYDPNFINGSLIRFTISSPCSGGGAFVEQSAPNDTFQNYSFQWQIGTPGSVDLVITNLLAPLENLCDLAVKVDFTACGVNKFQDINITMIAVCAPELHGFLFDDHTSVPNQTIINNYIAANPTVDALIYYDNPNYNGSGGFVWESDVDNIVEIVATFDMINAPGMECCTDIADPDFFRKNLFFDVTAPCLAGSHTLNHVTNNFVVDSGFFLTVNTISLTQVKLGIQSRFWPTPVDCIFSVTPRFVYCVGEGPEGELSGPAFTIIAGESCNNNIDFIHADDGTAAAYLAANPGVSAVVAYDAQDQLVYTGTNQYAWNSAANDAVLRCNITEQAGTPLDCCPNYTDVINGETGEIVINSACLSGPISVTFASPVANDSGFTFTYSAGAGFFELSIVNDNAPTQAGPCTFNLTTNIGFCTETAANTGPVITVT